MSAQTTNDKKDEARRARQRENSARYRARNPGMLGLHIILNGKQDQQLNDIAKYLETSRSDAVRQMLTEMHAHITRRGQSSVRAK